MLQAKCANPKISYRMEASYQYFKQTINKELYLINKDPMIKQIMQKKIVKNE